METNESIHGLASNSLQLKLLFLAVKELGCLPSNRSELYQEGLNVLLQQWDDQHKIEGEQIYKQLSAQRKQDLLSQIALAAFQQDNCFLKQEEIEQHIADRISKLPNVSQELKLLRLNSKSVLKSIEVQHGLLVKRLQGVYSFSHQSLHEYFVARGIVASSNHQELELAFKQLVSHVAEQRWNEVFLFTVEMLNNADRLLELMKQQIDSLLAADGQLQEYLAWVNRQSFNVPTSDKREMIRAFYLDLTRAFAPVKSMLKHNLSQALTPNFNQSRVLAAILDFIHSHAANPNSSSKVNLTTTDELKQYLEKQFLNSEAEEKKFSTWWKLQGQSWTEQLVSTPISYYSDRQWQFSEWQKELMDRYYTANLFLVDCMNNSRYINYAVRQRIEGTLLLPTSELKN